MWPRVGARILAVAAALSLVTLTPVHARESATAGLTPDEVARLAQGEVVVNTRVHTTPDGKRAIATRAYCVINRRPQAAWAVMRDYQKFPEFIPRLARVEILERTKDTMKVTETISMPLGTLTHTLDLTFDAAQGKITWKLDKSRKHDIADTSGSWEFLPFDRGRTVVRYTSTVESGMSVPKFLEEQLLNYDLPGLLESLKLRTESGGTWTKEQATAAARRAREPVGAP